MQVSKCLLVLCPLFIPAAALADVPAGYTITVLGGAGTTANALNQAGQVAGVIPDPVTGALRAYIWHNGTRSLLDTPINQVGGISNDGKIAGAIVGSDADGLLSSAAYYADGATTVLPALPGTAPRVSYLSGINSAGTVVGTQFNDTRPYGYTYGGGVLTALGGLGMGSWSYGSAINENGLVIASGETGEGYFHAAEFGGTWLLDFGTLDATGSGYALDVNEHGTMVGYSEIMYDPMFDKAWVMQNHIMQPFGNFPTYTDSRALGLNNLGQIVGESEGAFLYSDGVVYDLNTLAAHDGSFTLTSARDINDRGDIIATACDTGGGCYGVLLSPVPEPAPAAMLLAGLGLAGGLRYRLGRKKTCLSQKACL